MNYYNEYDPKAAAWLRELIRAGHIPAGDVDTRSILEVNAADLAPYTQCHFFAGIGGWSLALKIASWPTTRPVWTGSCPCQPFSAAGTQLGTADERHLWPAFFNLIRQRRPAVVLGEQVASKIALGWLDGVCADLEGQNYTVAAADLCAASVGAPHIRQRLYWMAHTSRRGFGIDRSAPRIAGHTDIGQPTSRLADPQHDGGRTDLTRRGPEEREANGRTGGVAITDGRDASAQREQRSREHRQWPQDTRAGRMDQPDSIGGPSGIPGSIERQEGNAGKPDHPMREPDQTRPDQTRPDPLWLVLAKQPRLEGQPEHEHHWNQPRWVVTHTAGSAAEAGPVNFWTRCGLIPCTDGKTRRIEPESFPLAHGISGRVGLLRGYGNAIVPPLAAVFAEIALEVANQSTP